MCLLQISVGSDTAAEAQLLVRYVIIFNKLSFTLTDRSGELFTANVKTKGSSTLNKCSTNMFINTVWANFIMFDKQMFARGLCGRVTKQSLRHLCLD